MQKPNVKPSLWVCTAGWHQPLIDSFSTSLCALPTLVHVCSELTDEDVRTAIKNSGGVKGSLLIPEAPFELLVRRAISRLLPSALQCQQFVHAELLRIASQCAPADVTRFPNLQVCRSVSPSLPCHLLRTSATYCRAVYTYKHLSWLNFCL